MAGAKEIRTQIKSIQNTSKITKAMQMVAASKMRRAQDRMKAALPYAERIRRVVARLAQAHPEYRHPYLVEREPKRVGYVIISTDRGLCGGLNINLFRTAVESMAAWDEKGAEVEMAVIGNKGLGFFRRFGANILSQATHLGDAPQLEELIGTIKVMLDAYLEGKIDRLYLCGNVFINTMTQKPRVEQLLPIASQEFEQLSHYWDYIYEPDSREVVDDFMNHYIESLIYAGVAENVACEQAARMVAMKAATDNAGKLVDDLQLIYNKARQAAITQELSEIVSGAAAV